MFILFPKISLFSTLFSLAFAGISIGVESSVEIFNKCSEIDGELNCERNQLSILRSKGDIIDYKKIDDEYDKYKDTELFYCKITIEAEVKPIKQNNDPTFHFEAELNQSVFRSGERMRIDINTSRKMYMYIFQWLPYAKVAQITKIFPNKKFQKITANLISGKTSLEYDVYFPENKFDKKIDEWLILVGTEKPVPWVNEYDRIERLYKELINPNLLVEKREISYIVLK